MNKDLFTKRRIIAIILSGLFGWGYGFFAALSVVFTVFEQEYYWWLNIFTLGLFHLVVYAIVSYYFSFISLGKGESKKFRISFGFFAPLVICGLCSLIFIAFVIILDTYLQNFILSNFFS